MRVFLGGTCNETTWRDELIKMFNKDVTYFNPVVNDWTPACQLKEEEEKWNVCDIHLYVITPKMTGVYSIAEIMESAFRMHDLCIFCYLTEDNGTTFDNGQIKSLEAVGKLVSKYGARRAKSLQEVADIINNAELWLYF